jgi:DNA-binding transcriptional regulator YhcF (GntR family)
MVDPDDDAPLYQQLANTLRDQITSGAYPPGSSLPTVDATRYQHDVGRETVRRALAVLREEGLISIKRGEPPLVRRPTQRQSVPMHDGDRLTSRMPSRPERLDLAIATGIPLLEIQRGNGTIERHAANAVEVVAQLNHRQPKRRAREETAQP